MITFKLSSAMKVQCLNVGNEQTPLLIIDGFASNAEELVQFAASTQNGAEQFKAQQSDYYPGVRKTVPHNYKAYLKATLPLLNTHFAKDKKNALEVVLSAFSIACTSPSDLRPIQMLPHFDTPNNNQFAIVHYLCDSSHGGTSLYRHKSSGFERITQKRLASYRDIIKYQAIAQKLHQRPHYINGNTELFERIHSVDAAFNRAIIYPSNALHSGNIVPQKGLSKNPLTGRLTISSFVILS